MKIPSIVSLLGLGLVLVLVPGAWAAQPYPSKPLRLIVPFPPGGGTDLIARLIGRKLNESLGEPVIIDNRPGANGAIGAELAARSLPDGHTLVMIISTHTVLPSLQARMQYDLAADFTPVIHVAELPNVLVVRPSLAVNSVADLVALARKRPNEVRYAGAGVGGPSHLSAELFNHMTGVKMLHVPYKGTGPAVTDLLGGHIDVMFATAPGAMPHVRSGKLRALAVTTLERSPVVPEVPTLNEGGVKGYEFVSWYGVLVRAGTPRQVVERLEQEIRKLLNDEGSRTLLAAQGATVTAKGSREFASYIQTEIKRWSRLIADTGIQLQ